jgi:Phage integrase, N-terminal SAM-like domain
MRGNLTRRGKNSWRLKFDLPTANGQRETRYHTFRGTKAEAQAEAAKIIASAATGQYVDASKETVSQFVERWLKDWAQSNVSGKTFERFEELVRKITKQLGDLPIQKLRPSHLQALYSALSREGLADRTRLHIHRVAHRMLGHAVQWEVLHRNPAASVDPPTVKAQEIEILTPVQVMQVLQGIRGRSIYLDCLAGSCVGHAPG